MSTAFQFCGRGCLSPTKRLRRRGITLIEILISVGVATIGLLGVISLIPLAASQTLHGEMAARGATIGNSAISELRIIGGLDPRYWITGNGATFNHVTDKPVPLCID